MRVRGERLVQDLIPDRHVSKGAVEQAYQRALAWSGLTVPITRPRVAFVL